MSIFASKHILLGVTGSIAAYKTADLASKLTQAGAQVDVILTPAAEKFITPLTFQSVTGRKAFTDADLWGGEAHVLHVGLGQSADLLVIAPCTANTLAKLAHGFADNLLTITALAMRSSILIAPAMDAGMFEHPATQENIRILRERGIHFAGPDEGHMASGLIGRGRMVEPPELLGHIRLTLGLKGGIGGKEDRRYRRRNTGTLRSGADADKQIFRKTRLCNRPGCPGCRRDRGVDHCANKPDPTGGSTRCPSPHCPGNARSCSCRVRQGLMHW